MPTPRALSMRDRVARAATEIGSLLRPDLPLDLAKLERTFIIRASDAMIVTVGHALDVLVRKEAPGVALHLVGVLLAEASEVDLDIGVQYGIAPDLRIQTLFHEEMVPVVRKDHPLAKPPTDVGPSERRWSTSRLPLSGRSSKSSPNRGVAGAGVRRVASCLRSWPRPPWCAPATRTR